MNKEKLVEKLSKTLSHFATVEEWVEWRKQRWQKQWEEESLKAYEESKSKDFSIRHGDNDVEQGPSV